MHIETVLKGFGCDWCGQYTKEGLRNEFCASGRGIRFPKDGSLLGWYSTATDTVLVLGDDRLENYIAYVWNTPNARELVLQGMGRVFGFINLPTVRR